MMSREWDKRAEHQGGITLGPFWGSRLYARARASGEYGAGLWLARWRKCKHPCRAVRPSVMMGRLLAPLTACRVLSGPKEGCRRKTNFAPSIKGMCGAGREIRRCAEHAASRGRRRAACAKANLIGYRDDGWSTRMTTIETPLTSLLGIKHPVLLAPMGSAAGGKLAAADRVGAREGLWLGRLFLR